MIESKLKAKNWNAAVLGTVGTRRRVVASKNKGKSNRLFGPDRLLNAHSNAIRSNSPPPDKCLWIGLCHMQNAWQRTIDKIQNIAPIRRLWTDKISPVETSYEDVTWAAVYPFTLAVTLMWGRSPVVVTNECRVGNLARNNKVANKLKTLAFVGEWHFIISAW